MAKYSILALLALISIAYVMTAPSPTEEIVDAKRSVEPELEGIEPSAEANKKVKRGIYGFGLGHYPFAFYPFGHLGGFGHGFGYHHYPYYSLGLHGYGYGHHYLW